jgi:hypothetical protein
MKVRGKGTWVDWTLRSDNINQWWGKRKNILGIMHLVMQDGHTKGKNWVMHWHALVMPLCHRMTLFAMRE